MKKTLFSIALSTLLYASAFAQSASRAIKSSGGFGREGMSTVNLYYGVSVFNGIYKAVAKNASANSVDIKYSSLGPVGLMYEYFVTDKVGIGVELGYSTFQVSYSYDSYDSNFNPAVYSDTWNFTTIRAMGRANFHFTEDENFDAYGFVGAGYRTTKFKYTTTDPDFQGTQSFGGGIPFGFKPGLGLRYFFTENLGINAEIALGSPLLSAGISAKF